MLQPLLIIHFIPPLFQGGADGPAAAAEESGKEESGGASAPAASQCLAFKSNSNAFPLAVDTFLLSVAPSHQPPFGSLDPHLSGAMAGGRRSPHAPARTQVAPRREAA